MKKHSVIFLVLISASFCSQAQFNLLSYNWRFIDTAYVAGERIEGWGVDADAQGYIYQPVFYKAANGSLQIRCRKFDASGNQLWSPPFNYSEYQNQISYVAFVNDSDLYIGGKKFGLNPFDTDMLLIRCDKNSGIIKNDTTHDFGMNGYDELDAIKTATDGIYCSGWAQSIMSGAYENEIGIWKLNYNFNTDFAITHGVANTAEHADGHMVMDSGFIYLSGLWGGDGIANLFDGKAFIGKFGRNTGVMTDSVLFGLTSPWINAENALTLSEYNNQLYTCGYTTPAANNWDIFFANFDKNLNAMNYQTWGGAGTESARSIAFYNNYVFVGANTQTPSPVISGQSDAVVLVYDSSGNFINSFYYDNGANENIYDLVVNGTALYISGTSNDSITHQPVESFLLSVPVAAITGETELQSHNNIDVFPNPFYNSFAISLNDNSDMLIEIFDLSGSIFYSEKSNGKSIHQIQFPEKVKQGLYFLKCTNGKTVWHKKILKID